MVSIFVCFSGYPGGKAVNSHRGIEMSLLHQETMDREAFILSKGFTITSIWEHDYDDQLKNDDVMRAFIEDVAIKCPLNPRDAFKGGRVNAFKLYHQVQPDEKIHYYDVTSEYPFINKNKVYPIGHPEIIRDNFRPIKEYFGLVKCTVNPPRGLLLPVIPARLNNKLYFPLCRTCARDNQKTPCQHTDEDRAIHGTFCTPELMKAEELGYTVRPFVFCTESIYIVKI